MLCRVKRPPLPKVTSSNAGDAGRRTRRAHEEPHGLLHQLTHGGALLGRATLQLVHEALISRVMVVRMMLDHTVGASLHHIPATRQVAPLVRVP